jgi:hypothetical protein
MDKRANKIEEEARDLHALVNSSRVLITEIGNKVETLPGILTRIEALEKKEARDIEEVDARLLALE